MSDADKTQVLDSALEPKTPEPQMQDTDEISDTLPEEFLAKRKKAKRKRLIKIGAVIVVIIIIAAVVLAFVFGGNEDAQLQTSGTSTYTEQVTSGDFDLTVEGSGELAASSSTSVSPTVSGTVKKIYVNEGDEVKKGDTLFTMISDDVDDAVEETADAVETAAESLADAKSDYKSAKKAYKKAKKAAKKASSSSNSNTGSSNTSNNSSSSSSNSNSSKSANSTGSTTRRSSNKVTSVATTKVAVASTRATTSTVASSSATTTSVTEAKSALSQAKSTLVSAKSSYKQAVKDYQDALEQQDALTVTASSAGTVTAINISKGDTVGTSASSSASSGSSNSGSTTSSTSSAAMTISDYSKMSVTTSVSEYDINNIKKNQKATIMVTSLDKTVKGKVTAISKTASSSSSSSGNNSSSSSTAYYDVTITINKPTAKMIEGMSVTTEIVYASYKDTLLVPAGAVSEDSQGNSYVTLQGDDGTTSQVSVTVKGSDDEYAAIDGDLTQGQTVLVTYQVSDTSGTESTSSNSGGMGSFMGGMSGGGGGGGAPSGGGGGMAGAGPGGN